MEGSNHYAVHLKLIQCYANYNAIKKKKKPPGCLAEEKEETLSRPLDVRFDC